MTKSPWWPRVAGLFGIAAAVLLLGSLVTRCSDHGEGDDPPVLGSTHLGWKNPVCSSCHSLPISDHATDRPPQCASCHGANGACDPNGAGSGRQQHVFSDDCLGCHIQQHGFSGPTDCRSCHFASAGVVSCPGVAPADGGVPDSGVGDGGTPDGSTPDGGTGPNLSQALLSNCYDWPATEWSSSNNTAGVHTALGEGAPAVEFTLKDTQGVSHTLSDLLATRPVLLVFGAFT